jgi:predicted DNA-binding transcriptional regulator YafY
MKFTEYQGKVNFLLKLASYSNTGTPKELAKRLNVSERTLYRLIENLKSQDVSIVFCRKSKTYMIKE